MGYIYSIFESITAQYSPDLRCLSQYCPRIKKKTNVTMDLQCPLNLHLTICIEQKLGQKQSFIIFESENKIYPSKVDAVYKELDGRLRSFNIITHRDIFRK